MIVSVDNVKIEVETQEVVNLFELIDLVNRKLLPSNKVVFQVFIDGDEANIHIDKDISNVSVIEMTTKSPRVLLMETLNEMSVYIKRFHSTLDEIDLYLSNDDYRISDLIMRAVDGLEWIYSVLTTVLELTVIDFEAIDFKDTYFNFEYILNYFLILVEKEDFKGLQKFMNEDLKGFLTQIEIGIPKIYDAIMAEEKEERVKA